MRHKDVIKWWKESGKPRLLAVHTVRGTSVILRYLRGKLTRIHSEDERAGRMAPDLLPRKFSGTIRCRIVPIRGAMTLVGTGYTLDSTPIKNQLARRRLLKALGFHVEEGRILVEERQLETARPGLTVFVDDVETGLIVGRKRGIA